MSEIAKVTVPGLMRFKGVRKITMVTAYDAPTAMACDAAGVDAVLVGDSLGMVVMGCRDTLGVTMDDMLHHLSAVRRGLNRALLVADMPYLSYHITVEETVRNAGRFIKEGGAEAVKLEGGEKRVDAVRALIDAEIPVMGHLGLTPQSVHSFGGYRVQARESQEAKRLVEEALLLQEAGVFSIVLEGIPNSVAESVTEKLTIPTIGIGAGPCCDGQVLVFHDLLGWSYTPLPKFVRSYADLKESIHEALVSFKKDVETGVFPDEEESYGG